MQLSRSTAAFIVCLTLSLFLCSTSSASPITNVDQKPSTKTPQELGQGRDDKTVSSENPDKLKRGPFGPKSKPQRTGPDVDETIMNILKDAPFS
ncbi:hypothetical protein IWQ61_008787 [Dispira simplex]|nr:hypothetical protein IWQ61_008787 [Dispira simplex]